MKKATGRKEKGMIGKVAAKVAWVGRTASMVLGLALVLGLVFGVGTMALAAVPGDPFRLGQVNPINTITRLAGNTDNPMLRINNASTGANATALDLQVKPGRPPMKVNSSSQVANLNATFIGGKGPSAFLGATATAFDTDRFDGKFSTAYFSGKTYTTGLQEEGPGQGGSISVSASCDVGDIALGGGGSDTAPGTGNQFEASVPDLSDPRRWNVRFVDENTGDLFRAFVRCADFPPLR